jgi:hypothetical protein
MRAFLRTSEIGLHSVVAYRAKVLGITPIGTQLYRGKNEKLYTVEDADRILSYKAVIRFHSISYFYILKEIIEDETMRYNIPHAAVVYNIKESKLQNMIDEYNKSGCFITSSKMNYEQD